MLLAALSVRLIAIAQPYTDDWSWRETSVAMIARNFYAGGFNFFYPQIDWAGPAPGYAGYEFPLVPFIAALLYVPAGVSDWVGRSVSVLFFAASVPFIYLLVKKQADRLTALIASVIYAVIPINVFASRSFMSDMASLSLSIIALYLVSEWLDRPTDARLFLMTFASASLAILVKLPAIVIGIPCLYMAWQVYGPKLFRRRELWLFVALTLALPFAWYFHARQLAALYPPHLLAGDGVLELTTLERYAEVAQRTATHQLTPLVTAAMLVGMCLPVRARFGHLFHWWLIGTLALLVLAGYGNWLHDWYQLPFVPPAAAFAGRASSLALRALGRRTRSRLTVGVAGFAALGLLGSLSYLYVKPLYRPHYTSLWVTGRELAELTPPGALLVIADTGHNAGLYYSGRKGWHFVEISTADWRTITTDGKQAVSELERLRGEGADYFAVPARAFRWFKRQATFRKHLVARYRRVANTKDYVVFDLRAGPGG